MVENSTSLVRRGIPRVSMFVIDQPEKPVMNGKNRWKFPSSKDCCVKIVIGMDRANDAKINKTRSKNVVPVRYDQQRAITERKSKRNGAKFVLELSSITRHPVNDSSLIDVPLNMVCLQRPLNSWKFNKRTNNDFGFWFRFFGRPCRFRIRISLKVALQGRQARSGEESEIIDTVELDIVNLERIDTKSVAGPIGKPLLESSLYCENGYLHIMQELQTLCEVCLWQQCRSTGDRLLSELGEKKSDYKVCIFLKQSIAACHQGEFKDAKILVKKALEVLPAKSKNKELLTGRAYTCLSLSHQYDMAFGNAEECLRIAKTKFCSFIPCEDTGDFYYQEGRMLLGFIFRLFVVHNELLSEAKEKFEKAVHHFRESHNWKRPTIMNKIHSAQMYTAMLIVLGNKGSDSFVIADQLISDMAEVYTTLNHQTKCIFNLAQGLLLEQKCDSKAAQVNYEIALDLTEKCGLYPEKQWIKNFLRRLPKPENEVSSMPHNVITQSQSFICRSSGSSDCEVDYNS